MKLYYITFSYCIDVQAENEDEAIEKALCMCEDIKPKVADMNIETEESEVKNDFACYS